LSASDPEPQPSATIVVVRDGSAGFEVLLLERASREPGKAGASVFPGGRVEATDLAGQSLDDAAFRRAAVREAHEEAGLVLEPKGLVTLSRWITPEIAPRRFDTWFYLAEVSADVAVRVDGGEIGDHRWLEPHAALAAHHDRAIRLAPPTFVTVSWLEGFESARHAQEVLGPAPVPEFRPHICQRPEGACMLYPGDAGYEASDPDVPGPRHRLWARPDGWEYTRDGSG
jgi:8-oxo-dGTP pyrophosphatase MutT (NUDIX family)